MACCRRRISQAIDVGGTMQNRRVQWGEFSPLKAFFSSRKVKQSAARAFPNLPEKHPSYANGGMHQKVFARG
jgi:hypothetical protein